MVAESGSLAKAAVRLSVTQPAVSKAISNMEHTLGARLLDRGPKGVAPTPQGRALLRHGLAAFDDLRHAVKEIEFLSDPEGGELRIGTQAAMMAGLLPAVIDRLTRRYPRLVFHIVPDATIPELHRELCEGNVELLLSRLAPALAREDDLITEILTEEPSFVVTGSRSLWARRRKISAQDLVSEQWVFAMPNTVPGSYAKEAFRRWGLEIPRRAVVVNSIEMHAALAATGRFLTLLPRSYLRLHARRWGLRILPLAVPVKTWPIGITRLKNRTMSPMAERFVACAKDLTTY